MQKPGLELPSPQQQSSRGPSLSRLTVSALLLGRKIPTLSSLALIAVFKYIFNLAILAINSSSWSGSLFMVSVFDLPDAAAKRLKKASRDLEGILRLQVALLMEHNKEKSQ